MQVSQSRNFEHAIGDKISNDAFSCCATMKRQLKHSEIRYEMLHYFTVTKKKKGGVP